MRIVLESSAGEPLVSLEVIEAEPAESIFDTEAWVYHEGRLCDRFGLRNGDGLVSLASTALQRFSVYGVWVSDRKNQYAMKGRGIGGSVPDM